MKNKIKLSLDDLQVESFVTTLPDELKNTLFGGTTDTGPPGCCGTGSGVLTCVAAKTCGGSSPSCCKAITSAGNCCSKTC